MTATEHQSSTDDDSRLADITQRVARFGGTLGLGVIAVGLVILFFGWNGAASFDRVPAQFPYLISGGLLGLGVMVVGAALLIIENQRKDRAALQATLAELREAIDRMASASGAPSLDAAAGPALASGRGGEELVVGGEFDYVRVGSPLAQGRDDAVTMTRAEAEAAGLSPNRVDFPEANQAPADQVAAERAARRQATAAEEQPFAPPEPPSPPSAEAPAPTDSTSEIPVLAGDAGEDAEPEGSDRKARRRRTVPSGEPKATRRRRLQADSSD